MLGAHAVDALRVPHRECRRPRGPMVAVVGILTAGLWFWIWPETLDVRGPAAAGTLVGVAVAGTWAWKLRTRRQRQAAKARARNARRFG